MLRAAPNGVWEVRVYSGPRDRYCGIPRRKRPRLKGAVTSGTVAASAPDRRNAVVQPQGTAAASRARCSSASSGLGSYRWSRMRRLQQRRHTDRAAHARRGLCRGSMSASGTHSSRVRMRSSHVPLRPTKTQQTGSGPARNGPPPWAQMNRGGRLYGHVPRSHAVSRLGVTDVSTVDPWRC